MPSEKKGTFSREEERGGGIGVLGIVHAYIGLRVSCEGLKRRHPRGGQGFKRETTHVFKAPLHRYNRRDTKLVRHTHAWSSSAYRDRSLRQWCASPPPLISPPPPLAQCPRAGPFFITESWNIFFVHTYSDANKTHRIAAFGRFLAEWRRSRVSDGRRNVALGILRPGQR